MLKTFKAIIIGSVFIVIASLLLQLVYILVAAGYNTLGRDYPFLNEISGVFRYLLGIPSFLLVMFMGGYLTAFFDARRALRNCVIVGLITAGGMILMTLASYQLTWMGGLIFVLSMLATVAGGWYWQRKNNAGHL